MPLGAAHVTFLALHDQSEDKDLRMGGQSDVSDVESRIGRRHPARAEPDRNRLEREADDGHLAVRRIRLSTQARELHTFIDGTPIAGLSAEGDPTPDADAQWQRKADWRPEPGDVRFGWESYGDQANTLWFDDIAIAGTRIGCD